MTSVEDISTFLDTELCVSARWLSNTLQITIDNARNLMNEYYKSNPEIGASYLLTGVYGNGTLAYRIVLESDVDMVQKTFKIARSKDLYSLHKCKTQSYKEQLTAADYNQLSEIFAMNHPGSMDFFKNSHGYIKSLGMTIKPVGERILSALNRSVVGHTVAGNSATSFNTMSAKTTLESKLKNTASDVETSEPILKSKSSIQATNFFAKSASAAGATLLTSTANSQPPKASILSQSKSTDAAKKNSSLEAAFKSQAKTTKQATPALASTPVPVSGANDTDDEDEDAEWDDGSGYKPDPARLVERNRQLMEQERIKFHEERKKRQQEQKASSPTTVDTDAVEEQAIVTATEDSGDAVASSPEADGKKGKKGKKASAALVHGAMDDFFEDVAIEQFKQEQKEAQEAQEQGLPAPARKKRKITKLVEKVGWFYSDLEF